MALTDLSFPVTSKKVGPSATVLSRPKVYYLKSSDLLDLHGDTVRSAAILVLKTKAGKKKVEIYEKPDEFLSAQALSQGATGTIVFTKNYQNLAPTSSATAADQNVASSYYNEVNSINGGTVRLPDPFVRRLVVIVNGLTGPINVLGRGTTSPIQGSTAAYVISAGARIHFVAPTAATAGTTAPWKTAKDVGT